MWIQFFLTALASALIMLLPGLFPLMFCPGIHLNMLGFAPLVSFALYGICGVVFGLFDLSLAWYEFVLAVCFVSFAVSLALRLFSILFYKKVDFGNLPTVDTIWIIFLYIAIAISASLFIFVKNLDGSGSFLQEIDNVWHISVINQFAASGCYSSLTATFYPETNILFVPPVDATPSFYPAVWHSIVALSMSVTKCSVTVAINAVNFAISGVIYPLSIYTLLSTLFSDTKRLVCGSFIAFGFVAFPWQLLNFGPIYPNYAAFSLVPALCASFVLLIKPLSGGGNRIAYLFIVINGLLMALFTQPNSAFTSALILSPYLVHRIYSFAKTKFTNKRSVAVFLCVCSSILIALIWYVLYKTPFMQDTVAFNWPSYESVSGAIVNVLSLSLNYSAVPQVLLATFVLYGAYISFKDSSISWLPVSFILSSMVLIVAESLEGPLKHYLAGFWYTDPYRLSANVVISAIPLAVVGFQGLVNKIQLRMNSIYVVHFNNYLCASIITVVSLFCIFMPNFYILGQVAKTAFGSLEDGIEYANKTDRINVLSPEEIDFAQRVSEVVPKGALVFNNPNDGSVFLQALGSFDFNFYYRDVNTANRTTEIDTSKRIREDLDSYSSVSEVHNAVVSTGAKYVLLLDSDGMITDSRRFLNSYNQEQWSGFNRIADDTPGFEVVLKDGDMRLYRILV